MKHMILVHQYPDPIKLSFFLHVMYRNIHIPWYIGIRQV